MDIQPHQPLKARTEMEPQHLRVREAKRAEMEPQYLRVREAKRIVESYFPIFGQILDAFRLAFLTIIFGKGNCSRPRRTSILRCQVLLSVKCVGTLENNFGPRMKKKKKRHGRFSQQSSRGRYL